MPEIIDCIKKTYDNGFVKWFLILDKMPNFRYERIGNVLYAEDSGFYYAFREEIPRLDLNGRKTWYAYGGHEFDIELTNGKIIHAWGQWWDTSPEKFAKEPILSAGIGTLKKLEECYVFVGSHVSQKKVDEWLKEHKPKTDYRYYDKRFAENSKGA